jgi:hypothetical protein
MAGDFQKADGAVKRPGKREQNLRNLRLMSEARPP